MLEGGGNTQFRAVLRTDLASNNGEAKSLIIW